MNKNLYWSIFKNIEKEVLILSEQIHFDDEQLNIYSVKITELLIRTVVEVESISKELYFLNGGSKDDNNELFFDTDCIELLESKWLLSKKQVLISSPNFYFDNDENQILTPLKKANKRGSSSSDWLKAYQALKHNRAKNLKRGNLKNLIRALAGLYLLNIYYKDISYQIDKDGTGTNFDTNIGAKIFSIKIHANQSLSVDKDYSKKEDFDECVYLIVPTSETRLVAQEAMKSVNEKTQKRFKDNLEGEIIKKLGGIESNSEIDIQDLLAKKVKEFESENMIQVAKENGRLLQKSFEGLRYESVINKQQY